jgi:3-methylcrotonyl-CoA carboxylase alpha subunit
VLPKRQDELRINGWAMEARLYAEDPAKGFLPSVGRLDTLTLRSSGRVETGVYEGAEVSPFYDPMIAKLVTSGPTRAAAIAALAEDCGQVMCHPVKSNAWFLQRLLQHEDFAKGAVSTNFIGDNLEQLTALQVPSEMLKNIAAYQILRGENPEPANDDGEFALAFGGMRGFRVNREASQMVPLVINDVAMAVEFDAVTAAGPWKGIAGMASNGAEITLFENGAAFDLARRRKSYGDGGGASSGTILSPMPGKIIAVEVEVGQAVVKGQKLVTLEAMKMEHSLVAPFDGVVAELNAVVGGQVQVEAVLVKIAAGE